MLDRIKNIYRTALGGAAVALATASATAKGTRISLEQVNRTARILNRISAGVLLSYFGFLIAIYFAYGSVK